jgi:SAM-dependent methyltransferase
MKRAVEVVPYDDLWRDAFRSEERRLLFRDYLRLHLDVAAEYCALKRHLAHVHGQDGEAYQAGKSAFISRVEALAQAMNACTLCDSPPPPTTRMAFARHFLDCPNCGLVRAVPDDLPSPEVERARYATHENDPADARYRAFLDRLAIPLGEHLPLGARGLDFGCGPGPTLSRMLTERGWPTAEWDPFFAPDRTLLEERWDFVTCSEVLEHLHHPRRTLEQISALLRSRGWLGVMTEVFDDQVDFATWWYVRDPTHVAFYRPGTLAWIAEHFGWSLERPARNVALYRIP